MAKTKQVKDALIYCALSCAAAATLTACGGSSSSDDQAPSQRPNAVTTETSFTTKSMEISWTRAGGASYYQVSHNPDGDSGFTVIAENIDGTSIDIPLPVHLTNWENGSYIVEACNAAGCTPSADIFILNNVLETIGYIKPSELLDDAAFGFSLAISDDNSTLAVGAPKYSPQTEDGKTVRSVGKVYVYENINGSWGLSSTIDNPAPYGGRDDLFGYSLALSSDGQSILVSAPAENGGGRTVNAENRGIEELNTGAAYLYSRSGQIWQEEAYFKASNADREDYFGIRVDMTPDARKIVISSPYEASASDHATGDQDDNSIPLAGAVYVFEDLDEGWTQTHYIKPSTGSHDERFCFEPRPGNSTCYEKSPSRFGYGLSISHSGDVLAIGAPGDSSATSGINDAENDYRAKSSGAVHILRLNNDIWTHTDYIKAINPDIDDEFGFSLALSGDGSTLAIGSPHEDSSYQNVTVQSSLDSLSFDSTDETEQDSGAVYVLALDNNEWQFQAFIKAPRPDEDDFFGWHLNLSANGETLAVGMPRDDSEAKGVNVNWDNSSAPASGAVNVYGANSGEWSMINYVKASNTDANDTFGRTLALSSDGSTLAVAATGEDSRATTIQGDQSDDTGNNTGAVYLY